MPTVRIESMSHVDSAWLHMDSPTNLMLVSGVLVLDGELTMDRLRQVVEHRLLRFDRFRQRVVETRGMLPSCRWEPDPDFDLRHHLVREELPAPRDEAALQALVGRLMSEPLDPDHPLWQFHLVDDYRGGSALITRLHHCIGDGIALIYALLSLTDDTPDAPAEKTFPAGTGEEMRDLDLEELGRRAGRGVGRAANVTSDFLMHPAKAQQAMAGLSASTAALGKLVFMAPDPRTPFKGALVEEKRAVWSKPADLDRIKAVGRKTGSTVNDLLLAAVSGALRRYLDGRGHDLEGLDIRAVVPVNLRRPEDVHKLGNQFGLVFLALPLGIDEPLDRVFELKSRMDSIKSSPEAHVAFQILRGMGMAPRQVYEQVLRLFGKKATAVMTNVKGPTETIYFGGTPIRQVMAFVPRSAGLGIGVSILSYNGKVCLGIATDAGLVPDPERILDGFYAELEELFDLVRIVE
jgi:WS/DGAT/MGAT family acyltransferase